MVYFQSELCPRRPVICAYCELELPHIDLQHHLDYCGTRTERCDRCEQYVMCKDFSRHQDSDCQYPGNTGSSDSQRPSRQPISKHSDRQSTIRTDTEDYYSPFAMDELRRMLNEPGLKTKSETVSRGPPGRRDNTTGDRHKAGRDRHGNQSTNSHRTSGSTRSRVFQHGVTRDGAAGARTTRGVVAREKTTRNQGSSQPADLDQLLALQLARDLGHPEPGSLQYPDSGRYRRSCDCDALICSQYIFWTISQSHQCLEH